MVCCSFVGCRSKFGTRNIKFHRIPIKRTRLWARIINRKDWKPLPSSRVCSRHFVSGYPGWEPSDPDWIPSLNIPSNRIISNAKLNEAKRRAIRCLERSKKREENYNCFREKLVHQQNLNLSLQFHDYCSKDISLEETIHVTDNSIEFVRQDTIEDMDSGMNIQDEIVSPFSVTSLEETLEISSTATLQMDIHDTEDIQTDSASVSHQQRVYYSRGSQTDYIDLEIENRTLREENKELMRKLQKKAWGVDKIRDNDEMTKFYTGLPSFNIFMWLFTFLKPKAERMTYWGAKEKTKTSSKRTRKLALQDEFLAVMMRLKVGLFHQDIADRFEISSTTYSRIFCTWIKLMKLELKELFPFPTRALVDKYMPQCFLKYPQTRIIIDCTEIFIERPKSLETQNMTFSNYKSHNTFKFLVGITPGGVVSFVSDGWGGRVSDKVITRDSGLILLLDEGDNVMADKGFLIEDLLKEKKCGLNLPPFLKDRPQFTEKEIIETRRIAELRIHVERAIARTKKFHIFDGNMPITLAKLSSDIFAVCCYLTNIYEPLV